MRTCDSENSTQMQMLTPTIQFSNNHQHQPTPATHNDGNQPARLDPEKNHPGPEQARAVFPQNPTACRLANAVQ